MSGRVVHAIGPHAYDRYCGRANPRHGLEASPLRNHYRIGKHGDRADVLHQYRDFLNKMMSLAAIEGAMPGQADHGGQAACFMELVNSCAGLTLACWCPEPRDRVLTLDDPIICHCQLILAVSETGELPRIAKETEK